MDSSRRTVVKRSLLVLVAAAGISFIAGATIWALACPCETVPGFVLRGDVHEGEVTDWTFANSAPLCQLQLSMGWRPHSLNLNCMATPEGDLFLSCSYGARKYWCPRVEANHAGRVRIDGVIYSVFLNRARDVDVLDRAWRARVLKLQQPEVLKVQPVGVAPAPDAPRPTSWWSFRVTSRADR